MGTLRADVGWLIVRVAFGLGIAYFHGYAKVFLGGASGLVATIGNMGLPAPHVLAWCAALAELAGGLMVALGLATRYAASAVSVTMVVALYHHLNSGDPIRRMELAALYLAAMLAAVLIGGGRYSLDQWIRLRWPIERRG